MRTRIYACHFFELNCVRYVIITVAKSGFSSRQGMVWNKKWNGTEILVWNMEDATWNGMKDNLPYFHTNSILDFVHCTSKKYMRISGSCRRCGVEDSTFEAKAKGSKKSEAKDRPIENRPSQGQGQEASRPKPRAKDTILQVVSEKRKWLSRRNRTFLQNFTQSQKKDHQAGNRS